MSAYERIRAARDARWPEWGEEGAPWAPATDSEMLWYQQGIAEGLAHAMTLLEQDNDR